MFFVLKLYLAHLIADFLLQSNALFELKSTHRMGHIIHALIHTGVSIFLLLPFAGEPFLWVFVIVSSVIHLLQDILKYHVMKQRKIYFPAFVIDQIMHFIVLASVLLFPESLKFPDNPQEFGGFGHFYWDSRWTVYGIAFILTTVAGAYTLNAFQISYVRTTRGGRAGVGRDEMIFGSLERIVVSTLIYVAPHPIFWILTPLAGALRILAPKNKNYPDFMLSGLYAAVIGLILRLALQSMR